MFVEAVVFLAAIIGILLALGAFIFHTITHRSETELNSEKIEEMVDTVCDAALEEINKTAQLVMDELSEKYKALLFVYQLMDDKQKNLEGDAAKEALNIPLSGWQDEMAGKVSGLAEIFAGSATATSDAMSLDISVGDELDVIPVAENKIEPATQEVSGLEIEPVTETKIGFGKTLTEALSESELEMLFRKPDHAEDPDPSEPIIQPRAIVHPKYEEIKEMQCRGLEVSEIARELGMGKGEINLIIGLGGR